MTIRTQEEILYHMGEIMSRDVFGFVREALIDGLDWSNAKQFLGEGATEELWNQRKASPLEQMKSYMPFAISKAQGHRGLSAGRSINHFEGWLWLADNRDLAHECSTMKAFQNYGAPLLKKIAQAYNLEWPEDEGINNMAEGKPCQPNCEEGCA